MTVKRAKLPAGALLFEQAKSNDYTDCFSVDLAARVSLDAYIRAFYLSWLFRLERMILRMAGHPSTDQEVGALACGGQICCGAK